MVSWFPTVTVEEILAVTQRRNYKIGLGGIDKLHNVLLIIFSHEVTATTDTELFCLQLQFTKTSKRQHKCCLETNEIKTIDVSFSCLMDTRKTPSDDSQLPKFAF